MDIGEDMAESNRIESNNGLTFVQTDDGQITAESPSEDGSNYFLNLGPNVGNEFAYRKGDSLSTEEEYVNASISMDSPSLLYPNATVNINSTFVPEEGTHDLNRTTSTASWIPDQTHLRTADYNNATDASIILRPHVLDLCTTGLNHGNNADRIRLQDGLMRIESKGDISIQPDDDFHVISGDRLTLRAGTDVITYAGPEGNISAQTDDRTPYIATEPDHIATKQYVDVAIQSDALTRNPDGSIILSVINDEGVLVGSLSIGTSGHGIFTANNSFGISAGGSTIGVDSTGVRLNRIPFSTEEIMRLKELAGTTSD